MRAVETTDAGLIRRAIVRNWRWVADDGSGAKEDFAPVLGEGLKYVLIEDRRPRAVFFYHVRNAITYEVHTCPFHGFRGPEAVAGARLSLGWMFDNTPCRKVITHVPSDNRLAYEFAKRAGMVDEGVNRLSFLKDGQLLDQNVLGITSEEFRCQQQFR